MSDKQFKLSDLIPEFSRFRTNEDKTRIGCQSIDDSFFVSTRKSEKYFKRSAPSPKLPQDSSAMGIPCCSTRERPRSSLYGRSLRQVDSRYSRRTSPSRSTSIAPCQAAMSCSWAGCCARPTATRRGPWPSSSGRASCRERV